MNIPKGFRPEKKDLDGKTEQLLKGAKKLETLTEPVITITLEDVLKSYDYVHGLPPSLDLIQKESETHLYPKVDMLIQKAGYKPMREKELRWDLSYEAYESFKKPKPSRETFIFIKGYRSHLLNKFTNYYWVYVQNGNINEFFRRFEKMEKATPGKFLYKRRKAKVREYCIDFSTDNKQAIIAAFCYY